MTASKTRGAPGSARMPGAAMVFDTMRQKTGVIVHRDEYTATDVTWDRAPRRMRST